MKKSVAFLLLAVMFLLSLVGCSSETLKSEKINDTDLGMEMSYDEFTGERSKTVALKATTEIKVEVVTNGGEIALSITDEAGNVVYTGNGITTGSFNVTVDKDADYSVKVIASSHKGSYKITWE